MDYISLFSGIEAATVAWKPLGWRALAFSEVDQFCCELLARRYPDVPNLGDIAQIDWSPFARTADIVVGGSPCQAFSLAGNRRGLMDERSALMFEYIRAVHDIRPRWLLWENVPGVLSQSDGDAFETLLGELENCGYSLAWRVLDAQFYGVAQRRRRVFVVGHARASCAAAVLLERQSMCWDIASGRAKREALTKRASGGANSTSVAINTAHTKQNGTPFSEELAHTLDCAQPETVAVSQYGDIAGTLTARNDSSPCADRGQTIIAFSAGQSKGAGSAAAAVEIAPTLRASSSGTNQVPTICMTDGQANTSIDSELCGTITRHSFKDPPVICFQAQASKAQGLSIGDTAPTLGRTKTPAVCINSDSRAGFDEELEPSLRSNGHTSAVSVGGVRRLTPVECERLQGFPDGYTDLGDTADTPRYKALGNSMAVPVMRWIGERIAKVDELESEA